MSNFVLVIDTNRTPLLPCNQGVARSLLNSGKASVFRKFPFTIILKKEVNSCVDTMTIKIDPGSKTTGVAVLHGDRVLFGMEISHRGSLIKSKILKRSALRRARRNRNARHRKPRFLNRRRSSGWMPPSIEHRVLTTMTWVKRLLRLMPISRAVQELVRFDTQAIENPEINPEGYQQGTLFGYEIREFLLEKWDRRCAYCNKSGLPLQVEHIHPRSRGGSDRISNLCIACEKCNKKKGSMLVSCFLEKNAPLLSRIKNQAKKPMIDCAAVNSTRLSLLASLKATGMTVSCGTGGQTKWNRTRFGLDKEHWIDAACVGDVDHIEIMVSKPLLVFCRGQGGRQKSAVNSFGYPVRINPLKPVYGWRTGDIARFSGKMYSVSPRKSGHFDLTRSGEKTSKNMSFLVRVHKADGYRYL